MTRPRDTCPGSRLYAATITDDGLAYLADRTGPLQAALYAPATELVVRFPVGVCQACGGHASTNTKGQIRAHTPRGTTP